VIRPKSAQGNTFAQSQVQCQGSIATSRALMQPIMGTTPLLPVADGVEVAAMAAAERLVRVPRNNTSDEVTRTRQALGPADEKPVGSMFSMAKLHGLDGLRLLLLPPATEKSCGFGEPSTSVSLRNAE
jgi:hypothetical protein